MLGARPVQSERVHHANAGATHASLPRTVQWVRSRTGPGGTGASLPAGLLGSPGCSGEALTGNHSEKRRFRAGSPQLCWPRRRAAHHVTSALGRHNKGRQRRGLHNKGAGEAAVQKQRPLPPTSAFRSTLIPLNQSSPGSSGNETSQPLRCKIFYFV